MQQTWKETHQLIELRKVPLTNTDVPAGVASGHLLRLTAEVAVPRDYFTRLPPWEKAEARAAAVGLATDKAVVCGMAAARLWGVPLLGVEKTVDLLLPGRSRPPSKRLWMSGTTYRSAVLPEAQITTQGGIRVTTLLRTLTDICRYEDRDEAVAAVDSVRRKWPTFTKEKLHQRLEHMGSYPGIGDFREVVEMSRAMIGSPWETKARLLLLRCGDPAIISVETQVAFQDPITGKVYYVDILINGWLVLEIDGLTKYRGAYGDDPETVILEERAREKALQNLGSVVLRVGKEDLEEPEVGYCVMVQLVLRGLQSFTAPVSLPRVA
ncbi:hypothetical protein [Corynebacterium sp.]|uniref:hypothetical protein n=1 Tax=Corynebacterium sp. TaxID=1720 RepID=UPI0026E030B9|nr:hypothetical protein [Corynebacterium sp.]MDO5512044.1 hypothetical protein [Corynebacterium sp.]